MARNAAARLLIRMNALRWSLLSASAIAVWSFASLWQRCEHLIHSHVPHLHAFRHGSA